MTATFQQIDPRSLFDAIGGDHATFLHLIGMFLRSAPTTRDALMAALAADQRQQARRLAHEMRGNVVIFGAAELAGALAQLEHALEAGPAPAALVAHCLALIEAVLAEMAAARAEHGPLTSA